MDLQRLLIERMENRILVGLTVVLASMVLVGWIAINETGRMASFQQQHLARSIEKGAELFANNCATCHGPDGTGSARAPGLNNPQLFSHDYLAPLDTQLAAVETSIVRFEVAHSHHGGRGRAGGIERRRIRRRTGRPGRLH